MPRRYIAAAAIANEGVRLGEEECCDEPSTAWGYLM
jgi:hypothetical protein